LGRLVFICAARMRWNHHGTTVECSSAISGRRSAPGRSVSYLRALDGRLGIAGKDKCGLAAAPILAEPGFLGASLSEGLPI